MGRDMLNAVYHWLLSRHGPQGWWPVTVEGSRAPVYGVADHTPQQKLEIVFSSILTQNTQWKPNVERAIIELHRKNLVDIDRMINATHEELAQAIRSAGYFNQKAHKLKNVAALLSDYPLRVLEKMDMGKARELLLGVNGIGPETADSIMLYALEQPIFVVDTYTRRMFTCLGLFKGGETYDDIQQVFMSSLPANSSVYQEYHALIVTHGKRHYQKRSIDCPLASIYTARKRQDWWRNLPVIRP